MSVQMGRGKLASEIANALGLPKNLRSFVLRVAYNEVITCTAEIVLDSIDGDAFETALVEYVLIEKQA